MVLIRSERKKWEVFFLTGGKTSFCVSVLSCSLGLTVYTVTRLGVSGRLERCVGSRDSVDRRRGRHHTFTGVEHDCKVDREAETKVIRLLVY